MVLLALIVIPAVFIVGVTAVSDKLLPWMVAASYLGIALSVLVFAPLAIARRTRLAASIGLFVVSYVLGATTWVLGLLFTWANWGIVGVIIGIIFLGIGVVATGALATLFSGTWDAFALVVVGALLTYLWRNCAIRLSEHTGPSNWEDAWGIRERNTSTRVLPDQDDE